jgi:putative peptidoglycan lipid II flippase
VSVRSLLFGYAGLWVATILQVLLQFWLQRVVAQLFGAGTEADALTAALFVPTQAALLLAAPLGVALVPVLSQLPAGSRERSGIAWGTLGGALLVTIPLTAGAAAFPEVTARWFFPGSVESTQALTVRLLPVLTLLFPLNTLIGLLQPILQAEQRFGTIALATVAGPVATLTALLASLTGRGTVSPDEVAWAIVLGAAVSVVIQVVRLAICLPPVASWGPRSVWLEMASLAGPSLVVTLLQRVDQTVERGLASVEVGSLAYLGYASRLSIALTMLTSGVLSTIAYPRLAAAVGRPGEFRRELERALHLLLLLAVPLAVVLIWFGEGLVSDLFERGRFGRADTEMVTLLLQWSLGLILGAGLGELGAKGLFSLRNTRLPIVVSLVFLVGGAVLKLWLVPLWGVEDGRAVWLVRLASAVAFSGGVTFVLLAWRVSADEPELNVGATGPTPTGLRASGVGARFLETGLVAAVGAGLAGVVAAGARQGLELAGVPGATIAAIVVGAVVYVGVAGRMTLRVLRSEG